jgi:hypothetical protein
MPSNKVKKARKTPPSNKAEKDWLCKMVRNGEWWSKKVKEAFKAEKAEKAEKAKKALPFNKVKKVKRARKIPPSNKVTCSKKEDSNKEEFNKTLQDNAVESSYSPT